MQFTRFVHTRLFVFSVVVVAEILSTLVWHSNPSTTGYLPFILFFLEGAFLCTLLKSNLYVNTFLLAVLIAILSGVQQWIAWQLGWSTDMAGVEGAIDGAILVFPIALTLTAAGGGAAVLIQKLWRSRAS
jgi:hypothetical protein